jgi:Protein of unknown function (DUF998)
MSSMQTRSVPSTRRSTVMRFLLTCGVVGPPLFVAAILIEGATRPGYSAVRNHASQLGLTSLGWMQQANFLIYGALVLAFAIGLRAALGRGKGSVAGPILLAGYALALIVAGIFPTDPGNGYPPGVATPPHPTTHGMIHGGAGGIVFVTLTAAIFVLSRCFAGQPGGRQWGVFSRATGLVVLAFFIMSVGPWFPSMLGLLQRVAIIVGWCWITVLAARLRSQVPAATSAPVTA